jgi:hypothetical protein
MAGGGAVLRGILRGILSGVLRGRILATLAVGLTPGVGIAAEPAAPVLTTLFPAGGRAGTKFEIVLEGSGLEAADTVWSSLPGVQARRVAAGRFEITLPDDALPGSYDLRAVGPAGMTNPRMFVVGRQPEVQEVQPNDKPEQAQPLTLETVVQGRVEKGGDVDCYRLPLAAGQRVLVEAWADRIDSPLRAVVEVRDPQGRAVPGERVGPRLDPLVDFTPRESGEYLLRVHDLSFAGGAPYVYRLAVTTQPRGELVIPPVVSRDRVTPLRVRGRNVPAETAAFPFDPRLVQDGTLGLRLLPSQGTAHLVAAREPGGAGPWPVSVVDLPVAEVPRRHRTPDQALPVEVPGAWWGEIPEGDEQVWLAVEARQGEVFWLEAFGDRLGSPVDLDLVVLTADGATELAHFRDEVENPGGYRLPLQHADPRGRWVAPNAGRYLVGLRNVVGGLDRDARRVWWLSIQREQPDFDLVAVSRRLGQPAGLAIPRGGREWLEVFAIRRRGHARPIRLEVSGLPGGVEAHEVVLGPAADRVPLVLSVDANASAGLAALSITGTELGTMESGTSELGTPAPLRRTASVGTMISAGQPLPSGRLTAGLPLLVQEAPTLVRVAATGSHETVFQEGALDLSVQVERTNPRLSRPVQLSLVGLPRGVTAEVATIPEGQSQGWISVQIPPGLAEGTYSVAVQAETEALPANASADAPPVSVAAISNPVVFRVETSRITLGVDPRAPVRIGRGKVVQVTFFAERRHGFIGKTHVELVAPGGVVGLRGRGVTLVGQSDSGVIQIIANDDAPLGQQPFLRLEGVGTVEDRPVYRATRALRMEIVE